MTDVSDVWTVAKLRFNIDRPKNEKELGWLTDHIDFIPADDGYWSVADDFSYESRLAQLEQEITDYLAITDNFVAWLDKNYPIEYKNAEEFTNLVIRIAQNYRDFLVENKILSINDWTTPTMHAFDGLFFDTPEYKASFRYHFRNHICKKFSPSIVPTYEPE